MAKDVYGEEEVDLIGGWHYHSLLAYGLAVYSRTSSDDKTEYALVSKGSSDFADWIHNFLQLGNLSPDMWASKSAAAKFANEHPKNVITMVGHSKGGAEALANAYATGAFCIIFNPAEINIIEKMLSMFSYDSIKLKTYVVSGDPLAALNVLIGGINWNAIYLDSGLPAWNLVGKHGMDAVIAGLKKL